MNALTHTFPALLLFAGLAHAQVAEKKSLTLDGARQVIAGAVTYAKTNHAPGGVIAVVDDGGNLMALERLDGTFAAGASISIGKARTAALFKKPTKFFEDVINKGRTAMAAMHENFTPLQGGVPIVIDGQIVGAVGVSGASSAQQDEELAMAGAAAIAPRQETGATTDPATMFDAKDVAAAFAKGAPLLETAGFKVHASRRTEPGLVEIHTRDADVIYVLEGTATLVTGGKPGELKEIGADELRGTIIEGGVPHHLKKGDVIIVPPGTPHQFTKVNGPFLYFVVKPSAPSASPIASR